MATVACNYVAIICFLASNWRSVSVMESDCVCYESDAVAGLL